MKNSTTEPLPELTPGLRWADPLYTGRLPIGAYIQTPGDHARAPFAGVIVKVNRVTVEYETNYMGDPMRLRARKDDIRGAYVRIGNDVHIYEATA